MESDLDLITTNRGYAARCCVTQVHLSHSQLRLCVSNSRIADRSVIQIYICV
jgi:hypothetical protein